MMTKYLDGQYCIIHTWEICKIVWTDLLKQVTNCWSKYLKTSDNMHTEKKLMKFVTNYSMILDFLFTYTYKLTTVKYCINRHLQMQWLSMVCVQSLCDSLPDFAMNWHPLPQYCQTSDHLEQCTGFYEADPTKTKSHYNIAKYSTRKHINTICI